MEALSICAMTSNYPWDGEIQLEITQVEAQTFTLYLRIPGWCKQWQVAVNGKPGDHAKPQNGYIALERTWQPGDTVALTLSMPVQTVWANPAVRQMQGRLAIQRGPIVYCLEGVDHQDVGLDRIELDPAAVARFASEHRPDLLGGVTVLRGEGTIIAEDGWDDASLYRYGQPSTMEPVGVTAIPYCVWDNRAPGEMRIWFRAKQSLSTG